jgi:hypothetical protein
MQLGLGERDRTTLVVGSAIVATLFVAARGVPALTRWQTMQRDEAVAMANELGDARLAQRLGPLMRDSLRAQRARLAQLDSSLLVAATPAAAASALAETLGELAKDAAVKVSAMQLSADSASTRSIAHVSVRMMATADIYGLAEFLRGVETGRELLAVRELAVSQPEPVAPPNKPEALRVDITVSGLARIATEARP